MSFAIVAGVGVGLVGASASRSASKKAQASADKATAAQEDATSERLDFDKQTYADGADDRAFASDMARTTAKSQAEDRIKYNALQDEQIARGRKFQASEDRMLVDANNYDTEAKREQMAGRAMADVSQGYASAMAQKTRADQRMGLNPSSGASRSGGTQSAIALAGMLAGAGTKARLDAETTGYARKMDALGLGKGMIGNQATQAGLQMNAGNNSVSNSVAPINVSNSATGAMSNAYGNAASGFSNLAGNRANGFYAAQQYGSNIGSSVGNMFGSILKQPGVTSGISNWASSAFSPDPMAGYSYNDFSGSGTQRAGM